MTFSLAAPAILAGLAGLAAALYLLQRLRVRHREVPVVTTLFWKQALEETRARVFVQRFRHLPAYLLLLAICALLWLGFADPRADGGGGARTALLLDASAGMREGDRFAEAKAALIEEARELPADGRHVIYCGGHVRTLLAPGENVLLLEKRLAGLAPEEAPSSLARVARALRREDPDIVLRVHGDPARVVALEAFGIAPAASGRWDAVDVLVRPAPDDGGSAPLRDGIPLVQHERAGGGGTTSTGLWRDVPAAGGRITISHDGREHALVLPRRAPIRVGVLGMAGRALAPIVRADPGLQLVEDDPDVAIGDGDVLVNGSIPSLDFVADADATFVLRLPEAVAQAGLEAVARDLTLAEIDGAALAEALGRPVTVTAEDPATTARPMHGEGHRAILVDAALLDPEVGFTRSRAFPLFVAAAIRRLARVAALAPTVAVGEPVVGVTTALTTADGTILDPLGVPFTPAVVGDVVVEDATLRTPDDPDRTLHASLWLDPDAPRLRGATADSLDGRGTWPVVRWIGLLALRAVAGRVVARAPREDAVVLAVTFLSPGWLHLAVLLPLLWVAPRRVRDVLQGILRTVVMACLILAIAQPVSFTTSDETWRVVVLDGSDAAFEADAARFAATAIGRAARSDGPTILVRGERALTDAALEAAFDHVVTVRDPRSAVPLGAMLAAAGRAVPTDARGSITVLSDGRATDRRWGPAVQDLQVRGLPVHVVPLDGAAGILALREVTLPEVARVGHVARIHVRADVAGPSATALLVDATGRELARTTMSGAAGRGVLAFEPEVAGVLEAEVRLLGPGGSYVPAGSNHRGVRLAVQPPLRVAYVGERMAEGGPRLAELLGPGFELAGQGASIADTLGTTDLLVIDDASADRVSADLQRRILQSVERDRLGLVMTGGRGAFGAGGWHDQPLAEALPIEMVQKEEKRDPSTTLVVIIDTSGSMGGNRVQLAKEVARLAIRRLLPHDKVGIVEFYGAKRWAAPIQPASNAIEIQRALNRLNAGGGTVIMPAIEEAFYGLQNVRTRYKHVLVLTDGGVEQGAFEPLVRRMAAKGITVSTVLIGPDACTASSW